MAVTGARLAWYAETDRYAAGVLAHHWPGVPNLGDVTALDWAAVPSVDLVSRRVAVPGHLLRRPGAGITKGTRSGLWLHIAAGLRHLRPSYVYLENVAALRTRGLAKVLADLAALGYDTQWTCLRAADAGAPHRRDRLFILAVRPGAGRTARGCCRPRSPGTSTTGRPCRPGRPAGTGRRSPAVTATASAPRCRSRSPCCPPRWPATSAQTRQPARYALGRQTADRPARRDHPPPRQPGRPAGQRSPARAGCCRPRTPAARRTATAGGAAGPATGTRAATAWTSRPPP